MAAHAAAAHHHEEHAHPGEGFYVKVAIALTIITAVEVIIYYLEGFRGFLVPALIVLSIMKFAAVVGFFMHLKFDDKRLAWIFSAGLAISLSVMIAMVVITHTGGYYAPVQLPPAS
jgi:cytochrome c oxidase subunit 4